MTDRPKIVYLANRNPSLSTVEFAARWRAHGQLAMSLPIWRNMWRYAQCQPVGIAGEVPPFDAIGLVWYRSLAALRSIALEPSLRQPLLDDELLTFSRHVREGALLTVETVVKPGPRTQHKLFLFSTSPDAGALAALVVADAVALVVSTPMDDEYTRSSTLPYRAVVESWYTDEAARDRAARDIRSRSATEPNAVAIAATERLLYNPTDRV
jgi:hypothetical protein